MVETAPMRPLHRLMPFDEARARWMQTLRPTQRQETVPFLEADGRVLATDVLAPIDVPHFDRSAMDGYAVRAKDVATASAATPVALRLVAAIHAGPASPVRIEAGQCAQIATGAPVPQGADAVVMAEFTDRQQDKVQIQRKVNVGENIGARGGDVKAGARALAKGTLLNPARIAVLAAFGLKAATVFERPRVTLVSTGSELRSGGQNLKPGLIYDSNSSSLTALLRRHGAIVEHAGIVPDDPDLLRQTLQGIRGQDLILVTGSSSAGEKDHLVPLLAEIGRIEFHGVNVKPGKPLLLGQLGPTPILGLAGNPASCLLMADVLVAPWLRAFQHLQTSSHSLEAVLAHEVKSPKGKRHFLPVALTAGRAQSVYKESDSTTSLSAADGYIEIPDDTELLAAGTRVQVHPF